MSEDASLDDFLGGESSEQSEADEEATGDDTDAETAEAAASADDTDAETAEAAASADDVEPATTTYAWSDGGTTCEACGETVERRWQQDGGLVCIDCKDWERA